MYKLILLISCSLLITAGAAERQGENLLECHLKKGEKFAVIEIQRADPEYSYPKISRQFNGAKLLYPVSTKLKNTKGKYIRTLALVSTANVTLTDKYLEKFHQINKENRTLKAESEDYDKLKEEWKASLLNELNTKAKLYEDTELEYLLSLKFFNKPLKNSHNSWKNDDILEFLYSISGMQDIRNAIPLEKNFTIADHQLTENPPNSLTLPKVQVPDYDVKAEDYDMTLNVPRSCYYVEFQNASDMMRALDFASKNFSQWSANTYPKSFKEAILGLMKDCGVDVDKMLKSPEDFGKIALAGWDPYYQSGTSLLVIVEKGGLKGGKHFYEKDGKSIFSNSSKLISMSKSTFNKGRSLFHDPAFTHSRLKVKPGKNERFFIYLSDYWLTNFLSARWQILNGRLAEVDARIRLTEILRLAEKAENNLKELPDMKTLRENYKDHAQLSWLMRDLKVENNSVVHSEYGGLYNHPAIDSIKFDKVSKHEKKTYESFINAYSANWREMDPLAFQINKEKDHWHSRLYISPISRLSDFRELSQVVLKKKEKHILHEVPHAALGLSLKFQTTLFQPFMQIKMPQRIQVALRAMDMAPRVESLQYIHKEERQKDVWSYTRMPVMAEVPTLLFNGVLPLLRGQKSPSEYEGLQTVGDRGLLGDWFYNIFIHEGEKGYSRIGVNPMPLKLMAENLGKEITTDIPSDIYFYADFSKGYTMHRYIMLMLARNRYYATWRRANRSERIVAAFSEDIGRGIFPQPDTAYRTNSIPDPEQEGNHWGSGPSDGVRNLPAILKLLKKLELFISVEDNALTFDTKIKLRKAMTTQQQSGTVIPPEEQEETELDFDAK